MASTRPALGAPALLRPAHRLGRFPSQRLPMAPRQSGCLTPRVGSPASGHLWPSCWIRGWT
eukprot:1551884-Alexandrium_andersonii.AAC.1